MKHFKSKDWDSQFFRRPIYGAELNHLLSDDDATVLREELATLSKDKHSLVEARVRSTFFANIPILEDLGFRLVDSRLEFRTKTRKTDFEAETCRENLRWFKESDWASVCNLTTSQFVDNPSFQSRFNNRMYFSRNESERYYLQWHRWALDVPNPLFCIWETDNQLSGFYSIVRKFSSAGLPEYKVALAAVRPGSLPSGMQNEMQFWLFRNAPDDEWETINSPALTNIAGLKNNIRAGKHLNYVEAYLFWRP